MKIDSGILPIRLSKRTFNSSNQSNISIALKILKTEGICIHYISLWNILTNFNDIPRNRLGDAISSSS